MIQPLPYQVKETIISLACQAKIIRVAEEWLKSTLFLLHEINAK